MAALTRLGAATKATLDEGLLGIYCDALEEIDSRDLAQAFDCAEKTYEFLPAPAELREMADAAGDKRREDAKRKAEAIEFRMREEEKRRLLESGEAMTLGDFVRKVREERPELAGLASKLADDRRAPISTESDEARRRRLEHHSKAETEFLMVELWLQLLHRARHDGFDMSALPMRLRGVPKEGQR